MLGFLSRMGRFSIGPPAGVDVAAAGDVTSCVVLPPTNYGSLLQRPSPHDLIHRACKVKNLLCSQEQRTHHY
uniref:Uncharacterized protein n=1 Tax=Oryza sativa subsp. japonica TaxID=39947 RepID=Q67W20_ORYSJ|nr:hypothetical protein [Oryza sativa Japonica Group]